MSTIAGLEAQGDGLSAHPPPASPRAARPMVKPWIPSPAGENSPAATSSSRSQEPPIPPARSEPPPSRHLAAPPPAPPVPGTRVAHRRKSSRASMGPASPPAARPVERPPQTDNGVFPPRAKLRQRAASPPAAVRPAPESSRENPARPLAGPRPARSTKMSAGPTPEQKSSTRRVFACGARRDSMGGGRHDVGRPRFTAKKSAAASGRRRRRGPLPASLSGGRCSAPRRARPRDRTRRRRTCHFTSGSSTRSASSTSWAVPASRRGCLGMSVAPAPRINALGSALA